MTHGKWLSFALVVVLCGMLVSCSAPPPPGDPKPSGEKKVDGQQAAEKKDSVQKKEKPGRILRTRDLIEYRNHFRNLGIAYATFESTQSKAPAKKEDLHPYLQGANKLLEMLDNGDIVFYYGVSKQQMEKGASQTILAHEAYEDIGSRRLVLMGDGTVQEMNNAEFDKAPKAKK